MSTVSEPASMEMRNDHKESNPQYLETHQSHTSGELQDARPCDIYVHLHSSKSSDEEIINTFNSQMEKHGVMETKVEEDRDRPGDRLVIITFQDRSSMQNFRRCIYEAKEKIMLDNRPVFFDFYGRDSRDVHMRRHSGRPRSPPPHRPSGQNPRNQSRYHRYIEFRDLESSRRDQHHREAVPPYGRRHDRYIRIEKDPHHSERGSGPSSDSYHENRTLFVGNIDESVTEEELTKIFERYGSLLDIVLKIPNHPNQFPYCFVKFKSQDSALAARNAMNLNFIGKSKVKIGFGKVAPSSILWFGAEKESVDTEELLPLIRRYANIMDMECAPSKSHCYVSFRNVKDAIDVHRRLNGARFGRSKARIQVDFADPEIEAKSLKNSIKSRERSATDRSLSTDRKRDRSRSSSSSESRASSADSDRDKRSLSKARSRSRSSSRSRSRSSSRSDSELSRTYRSSSSEDEEEEVTKKNKKKSKKSKKSDKVLNNHKESYSKEDKKKSGISHRNEMLEDDTIEDIEPLYSSDPDDLEVYAQLDHKRVERLPSQDREDVTKKNQIPKRAAESFNKSGNRFSSDRLSVESGFGSGNWQESAKNDLGRKRKMLESEDLSMNVKQKILRREPEIIIRSTGISDFASHSNVHQQLAPMMNNEPLRSYENTPCTTSTRLSYDLGSFSKSPSSLQEFLREFPIAWNGNLVVKNCFFPCNMHLITGNVSLVSKIVQATSLDLVPGTQERSSCLRILKRFSIMADKLHALQAETENNSWVKNYCILIGAPQSNQDSLTMPQTSSPSHKSLSDLVRYFSEKRAAGLMKLNNELSMYLLTPSNFTEEMFSRFTGWESKILPNAPPDTNYLMIILAK